MGKYMLKKNRKRIDKGGGKRINRLKTCLVLRAQGVCSQQYSLHTHTHFNSLFESTNHITRDRIQIFQR